VVTPDLQQYQGGTPARAELIPRYSECGSPPATFENRFVFRRQIASIINPSTPTLFFDQMLLLYRIVMFINTIVDFQDFKSTYDQSYMRNCDFEHFALAHFGHFHQAPPSPYQKVFA